jgi:multidrug efflux pump
VNFSRVFIARPVGTTLLTIGIVLAGFFAYAKLPVAPLPQVDFPTILVQAQLPGASPETVATSVAEPLERHLGQIADLAEMTSQSYLGMTRITLQFGLNRNIDGAARDVEAALNAAHADLPTSLRQNPVYWKVNPADAPILILALTSKTLTRGQLYDSADSVLMQKLSQIDGIGQVQVSGSALPAVRVELNPGALFKYGIGLEDVRAALASANANSPKGFIEEGERHYQLYTNDQATKAAQYKDLVVAYRSGAAVRLSDVAEVVDSVEDLRNLGIANSDPAVIVLLYRQPGANIIETTERVKAAIPQIKAALPGDVDINLALDRSPTIRASLSDTQLTLILAVGLVTLVVFVFLRNGRATLIPAVAVPVSIIGTFGVMYLLGYSLDILSLMALTISTGFVVDDAIVVLENISRHLEAGMPRAEAALLGAREVGFTVVSISVSLIAVFLPLLLMGGIVGRLLREFAVTLSVAVGISLVISLATTPMMCAVFLRPHHAQKRGRFYRWSEATFDAALRFYERTLAWSLRHSAITLLVLIATIGLNVYLFAIVPKGFIPQEDTGRLIGNLIGDQSISFQAMSEKLRRLSAIIQTDPAVASVVGYTGGRQTNSGFLFIGLKPRSERRLTADQVVARLRPKLAHVAGARLYLQNSQDIRAGGRSSNAQYQFTLQGEDTKTLYEWTPKLTTALQRVPILADVSSDLQQHGIETDINIDRSTAMRLGVTPSAIDNTLYDAFGQRQVSVIYNRLNQYHVVMEVAPRYWQNPQVLRDIYVSTAGGTTPPGTAGTNLLSVAAKGASAATPLTSSNNTSSSTSSTTSSSANLSAVRNQATNALANTGHSVASAGSPDSTSIETMVPLSAFTSFSHGDMSLSVNHQGLFVAATISFNILPGHSLGEATVAINQTMRAIGMPTSIHGTFAGTAAMFQQSVANEPLLILAALLAVYIVLGILYESYVHPITILSTLPSAGVGAVLALLVFNTDFSIIALIGVILLIGIVKKNAIMMIDFAINAERSGGLPTREAIFQAALMRFRPIMMTTFAALLGALPLALGNGEGSELRYPLGISIMGGLVVSQMLTLYTTPVVYLYLDRVQIRCRRVWRRLFPSMPLGGVPEPGE